MYILEEKTQNRNVLDLKRNIYGLLANIATHAEHRKTLIEFLTKNNKFQEITTELQQYPKSMPNFTDYIESILSVFVNITFDSNI